MRTILGSALTDDLIAANPCHIRGAGNSHRVHQIKPASLTELDRIIAELPDRYGLMILFACWCARVKLNWTSASRDAAVFGDPKAFDLTTSRPSSPRPGP